MKTNRRLCTLFLLAALLALFAAMPAALGEFDVEDVELDIYEEVTPPPAVAAEATPEPTAKPNAPVYEKDGSILLTMTFTGDMTIGSNVQASGTGFFEKELNRHNGDINFPMYNVRDLFLADDVTMVNFEGTLTTAGRNRNKLNNEFLFRAKPEYVSMLSDNGIETVSLENNHVMDMGSDGLAETKQTLLQAGITYASEGEPCTFYAKGVKIGSLAYQTFGGRHDEIIARLPQDIAALRDSGCTIVIVSYHWGSELDYLPNKNQIRLGRATVDAGADLVIGHHSHRINPIEYYNGKYICYSLGNFSFAGNRNPSDMSTFLFQIRFRLRNDAIDSTAMRIIPCRISSRTDYNDLIPTPYTKDSSIQAVLTTLRSNGKKLEYAVEDYPLEWAD